MRTVHEVSRHVEHPPPVGAGGLEARERTGRRQDRSTSRLWRTDDALEEEFALASLLIEARTRAKLTQAELADEMGTSQSTMARLESGPRREACLTGE
jgi:DNA-binding XRE family transcriptional regulator